MTVIITIRKDHRSRWEYKRSIDFAANYALLVRGLLSDSDHVLMGLLVYANLWDHVDW